MTYLSRLMVLLLSAALALLGGCSTQPPQQTWEGPARPAGEVALLEVPEQIQVMAIDGREPPPSFLRSQSTLALLPGEHVFSLRYVQLFQVNSEEHEVVRSRQAALRFSAVAGGRYRLEVPLQRELDGARRFAKAPEFRLVSPGGGEAVVSMPIKSFAEASLIDTLGKAFESRPEGEREVTNTDLLKDIWSRSSPEEREAFRTWLHQTTK
ncbi:MAG: hypothetical protein K0Q68_2512 [Moraxellaceae bacterium]|jgi:uncharacterized protein YccT (UPF0319 family)|nr:hypothetical protein [Moraxellaceae bacterium]